MNANTHRNEQHNLHSLTAQILIGLAKDVVKVINSPHDDGPVCQIGEHWFYFATTYPEKDLEKTAAEFCQSYSMEEIARSIAEALCDLNADGNEDEYLYYKAVLQENGCAHKS